MAEANFQNYGASGKIGNQVYYRTSSGKTGVREKVTPKNPKTNAQTLQRVIIAQTGLMYKAFKSICDHSFEGVTMGAKCANKVAGVTANTYEAVAVALRAKRGDQVTFITVKQGFSVVLCNKSFCHLSFSGGFEDALAPRRNVSCGFPPKKDKENNRKVWKI